MQFKDLADSPEPQCSEGPVIQRRPDRAGLPDGLKAGVERLSGYSMDDVTVHYNSGKPAQVQAYAYAQGTDIHLGPGQEKHLPHEAWHVVQQKQGRVKPTLQTKGRVNVNDDVGLEREADVMGAKALRIHSSAADCPVSDGGLHESSQDTGSSPNVTIQKVNRGRSRRQERSAYNPRYRPRPVVRVDGPRQNRHRLLEEETQQEEEQWPESISFQEMLENQYATGYFRRFVATEYTTENPDFVMSVRRLYSDFGSPVYRTSFRTEPQIFEQFVETNSPQEINLPHGGREKITEKRTDGTAQELRDAYRKAHREIMYLMESDTFSRFKKDKTFFPPALRAVAAAKNSTARPNLFQKGRRYLFGNRVLTIQQLEQELVRSDVEIPLDEVIGHPHAVNCLWLFAQTERAIKNIDFLVALKQLYPEELGVAPYRVFDDISAMRVYMRFLGLGVRSEVNARNDRRDEARNAILANDDDATKDAYIRLFLEIRDAVDNGTYFRFRKTRDYLRVVRILRPDAV